MDDLLKECNITNIQRLQYIFSIFLNLLNSLLFDPSPLDKKQARISPTVEIHALTTNEQTTNNESTGLFQKQLTIDLEIQSTSIR